MQDRGLQLWKFADITNHVIWEWDIVSQKIHWHAGHAHLLPFIDLNEDHTLSKWNDLIHPEDQNSVFQAREEALTTGEIFEIEYRVKKKDGEYAILREKAKLCKEEDKPVTMVGSWLDVTGIRQREHELQEAIEHRRELYETILQREQKLRVTQEELMGVNEQLYANLNYMHERDFILHQLQSTTHIGIWSFDLKTGRLFWSDEMHNILGIEKKFNIGNIETFKSLYNNSDYRHILHPFKSVIIGRQYDYFDVTLQLSPSSATVKWVRITGYPVHDKEKVYKVVGLVHDITPFKEAQEKLKATEEKFAKAFLDHSDLMVIVRLEDRIIVDVNKKINALGFDREEVLGKSGHMLNLFATHEERNRFYRTLEEKGFVEDEYTWRLQNGDEIDVLITASVFEISGKQHLINVVKDITDRKINEHRLHESEAYLNAIINNSNFMIWSVDREYRIMKYNNPFKEFMNQFYGINIKQGYQLLFETSKQSPFQDGVSWKHLYNRSLSGEAFKLSGEMQKISLEFSFNPIIEHHKVFGVSIFAEDVTERIRRDKELVEAQKKIGELRLMALRSVMNPHFIFNALNSIQYFIAQNDRKNAIGYLSTFSKLIRTILNNSIHNKIKLSEELNLIKHYVDLEKVRFDNKFDFQIIIDPCLDPEFIEIPSLLIQPYIENAILHGLYNKIGEGLLKLTVARNENNIVFEIEDDGIGRKAASELKRQNFPQHISIGSAITEERIRLVNKENNVSLEIIDLTDYNNNPLGTKVKIQVSEQ